MGDIDGDGAADFAVGAVQAYVDPEAKGYVWLVSGKTGEVIRELRGEAIGNRFGSSVAALQDLNGDGVIDIGADGGKDITIFCSASGEILKKIRVVAPNDG